MKNNVLTFCLIFVKLFVNADSLCDYNYWDNYNGVSLYKNSDSYYFITHHKSIDADGAPNAYHPEDIGLDYLANAGYPNESWWKSVLVADIRDNRVAYRQTHGNFKGYFVSKTSLEDTIKAVFDTSRYVDASKYPYLVFPGAFYQKNGTGLLGDIGYSINLKSGEASPFVVADIGPLHADLGEMSIALAENLGGNNVNPRNGAGSPDGRILYVIFPYSSKNNKWPLTFENLEKFSKKLLNSQGGIDKIKLCAENAPK